MQVIQAPSTQQIMDDAGQAVKLKIIDIGVWDMDANQTVIIAHGLTAANILSVVGYVLDDAGTGWYPLNFFDQFGGGAMSLGPAQWDATNIYLIRLAAGYMDGAAFNDGVMNRGQLYVWYKV